MQKNILYAVAFVVLVLLLIFLIDNISLGIYFHPIIYITFIIIMPLDSKPLWVLLLSTLMGLIIDMLTGMGGLNVIASTATGFLRPFMLSLAMGHNASTDGATPSLHRLSPKVLLWYIIWMVVLHSTIFFLLESLSIAYLPYTLLRLVVSDTISVIMIWYLVKLFTQKILNR